ncbi:MAG: hypothetical protein HQM09_24395 [Candidatus Riflebacteria bacterium]|nr:hypothetical protein [Candidatus Riflebacteria bacterium]
MTEIIYVSLKDIATEKNVSVDQLKYWAKLMTMNTIKRSRVAHVTAQNAERLKNVAAMIAIGMAPAEACKNLSPEEPKNQISTRSPHSPLDNSRLENIEKAILEMASNFQREISRMADENLLLAKQNQRLLEEMRSIKDESAGIRKLLVPPAEKLAARSVAMVPVKKEPGFFDGFHQSVLEIQEWMRGVLAPFTEVFRGS